MHHPQTKQSFHLEHSKKSFHGDNKIIVKIPVFNPEGYCTGSLLFWDWNGSNIPSYNFTYSVLKMGLDQFECSVSQAMGYKLITKLKLITKSHVIWNWTITKSNCGGSHTVGLCTFKRVQNDFNQRFHCLGGGLCFPETKLCRNQVMVRLKVVVQLVEHSHLKYFTKNWYKWYWTVTRDLSVRALFVNRDISGCFQHFWKDTLPNTSIEKTNKYSLIGAIYSIWLWA